MSVTASSGPLELKVFNAETGETAVIRLTVEDDTFDAFKREIQRTLRIEPSFQIILAGPPYKPLTTLDKKPKNIFVYNRKFFSKDAGAPQPVVLSPESLQVPSKESIECSESVLSLCGSQSPLLSAIPNFERKFKYEATRAELLSNSCSQALESCIGCVRQQQVQSEGLMAAVLNLVDYYETTKSSYGEAALQLRQQQYTHSELLRTFDTQFEKLGSITLHESLRTETRNTLLDCIPHEKVQQYKLECSSKHARVEELLDQLDKTFSEITDGVQACREIDINSAVDFAELQQVLSDLQQIVSDQQEAARVAQEAYTVAKNSIIELLQKNTDQESLRHAVSPALTDLDGLLTDRVISLVQPMNERCEQVFGIKAKVETSQTALQHLMYSTLRKVSHLQWYIQSLNSYVGFLKRARVSQEDAFQNLEHITSLPTAYQGFLMEMVRRRAYLNVFESKVQTATNEVAEFRNDETKRREEFMREHGRKLPPLFFELVPSLQEKPPFFSPSISHTASQWLPDITAEDLRNAAEQLARASGMPQLADTFSLTGLLGHTFERSTADQEDDEGGSVIFKEDPSYSQNAHERYQAMEYQNAVLLGQVSSMSSRLEQLTHLLQQSGIQPPEFRDFEVHVPVVETKQENQSSQTTTEPPQLVPQPITPTAPTNHDSTHGIVSVKELLEDVIASDPTLWNSSTERPLPDSTSELTQVQQLVRRMQSSVANRILHLQMELEESTAERNRLGQQLSVYANVPPKIAFREFNIDDVALFMPTSPREPRVYVAFHTNCPHRYLSLQSLEIFRQQRGSRYPEYVLGKIVFIESARATAESNPFGVVLGIEYHVLTVESLPPNNNRRNR